MCLPDFIRFTQIDKDSPLIGYRQWKLIISTNELCSVSAEYTWTPEITSHEVRDKDSGIYAYNSYNNYNDYNYNNYYNYYNNYNYCNNYNYYNNYNYNYNNYNYNNYNYNNYNYNISGIIKQWGKVAIHKTGQRSEYAQIQTLFTIRESDAVGLFEFLDWVKKFNAQIKAVAKRFNATTMHWQDFKDSQNLTER